ncbi:MAG TPA: hypothetical protein VHL78_00130 [Actinomycetota bacterium]|nr:hypothetical protein [Actinomycetota bacterium]
MSDLRDELERESQRFRLRPDALEAFHRRRRRRERGQRLVAGTLALVLAGAATWLAVSALRNIGRQERPARGPHVLRTVAVGEQPGPIAVGEGAVWVGDFRTPTLTRVDPATGAIAATIRLGDDVGIAQDIDVVEGLVWVKTAFVQAPREIPPTVVAIDPSTNQPVFRHRLTRAEHSAIAVGEGSIWSANEQTNVIFRRDARTGRVRNEVAGPPLPIDLAIGDGSVWVLTQGTRATVPPLPGSVVRIDPGSGRILETFQVGTGPRAITFGAGGVWVVNTGDSTVSRIDPQANAMAATIAVDGSPVAIAADEDAVWVATLEGRIFRMNPATNAFTGQRRLEAAPGGIAVDPRGGTVWTTLPSQKAIVQVGDT